MPGSGCWRGRHAAAALALTLLSAVPHRVQAAWFEDITVDSCPGRTLLVDAARRSADHPASQAFWTVHGAFTLDGDFGFPTVDEGTRRHWVVQLAGPLDASLRHRLEGSGVRLLQYVPHNCWKASITPAGINALRTHEEVSAVSPLCAVDKLPRRVLESGFAPRSRRSDGAFILSVTFFSDVSFEEAVEVLAAMGGATDQTNYLTGSRVLATLPPRAMPGLAKADEVSWIEDRPTPASEDNSAAATLSRIDEVQAPPHSLDGSRVRIGEWDGGEVQADHPDFGGRVVVVDHAGINDHSTHVAGTLVGDGGGNSHARGMAPGASLYSYDFHGDELAEMVSARFTHDIAISSNSWGYIAGWRANYYGDGYFVWFGDEDFGTYSSRTRSWDETVVATDLLMSKSAGNDRADDGDQDQTGHHHYPDSSTLYTDHHPPDGDWDCIGDIATAKNILTVGALTDSGAMTSFSAWGPCNDGRIKPDLTANGYDLVSTCPTDTYCIKKGTSMSTPTVGGAMALIVQEYTEGLSSEGPSPDFVRALLANTAADLEQPGPDYSTGWGLLDALAAVDVLRDPKSLLVHTDLAQGEVVMLEIAVEADDGPLKVTAAWTDPPGDPLAAFALVNDIDLQLVSPTGEMHQAWVLDPTVPSAAATRGVNTVDNIEQVMVESPEPGSWTVRLIGVGVQERQPISVVSSAPSAGLFADGFESGDTSRWSEDQG